MDNDKFWHFKFWKLSYGTANIDSDFLLVILIFIDAMFYLHTKKWDFALTDWNIELKTIFETKIILIFWEKTVIFCLICLYPELTTTFVKHKQVLETVNFKIKGKAKKADLP